MIDGVLTVSLNTRRDRELIAGLAAAFSKAADEGLVVATSLSGGGQTTDPSDDERLRRFSLFHEVVVGEVRHSLDSSLDADLVALIGVGWTVYDGGPTFWLDGCVVARGVLDAPDVATPPLLAVEVSEPATREFDRTNGPRPTAKVAAGGSC